MIGNSPPGPGIENPPMPTPDCVLPDAGSAGETGQVLHGPASDAREPDTNRYFWLYLLRPANPFDSDSPLVAVDSVRFPFAGRQAARPAPIPGRRSGHPGTNALYSDSTAAADARRSARSRAAPGASSYAPSDAYGFSEQLSAPGSGSSISVGRYGEQGHHHSRSRTRWAVPTGPPRRDWDYIPLPRPRLHEPRRGAARAAVLRRGCSPRSSSKQAPPVPLPPPGAPFVTPPSARPAPLRSVPDAIPQTYPYLADEFFYTGAPESAPPHWAPPPPDATYVGGPGGAGWFKMLEFLEVPSRSRGATGRVSQGMNFDADRQDRRPGLLNLNLIIDEEVFLGLMGRQPLNFLQATPRAITCPGWSRW